MKCFLPLDKLVSGMHGTGGYGVKRCIETEVFKQLLLCAFRVYELKLRQLYGKEFRDVQLWVNFALEIEDGTMINAVKLISDLLSS